MPQNRETETGLSRENNRVSQIITALDVAGFNVGRIEQETVEYVNGPAYTGRILLTIDPKPAASGKAGR